MNMSFTSSNNENPSQSGACAGLQPDEFRYLTQVIKDMSGITLAEDKAYLIESRLLPLSRENGLRSLAELVQAMKSGRAGIITQVINSMVTHETLFFRDKTPFDNFTEVMLPALLERNSNRKSIRIWCAAASSGQEPYSLALILKEREAQVRDWRFDIVGTDISGPVVERAKLGIYTQFEVQRGMPIQMLLKYFKQNGNDWQLNPEIRQKVQFYVHNLLDDFKNQGRWDIVFCRNVLIYFDPPTKAMILDKIASVLEPNGYLVLGGAETVLGISNKYRLVEGRRGMYQLA